MKVFHTVAIPHKDILEGRLTMDVFAADLWEVSLNRGSDEYKDSDTFFRKKFTEFFICECSKKLTFTTDYLHG